MITLYQFDISPFCDKVRRILNVKKEAYTCKEVPLLGAARMKELGPARKVPALDHDGHIVNDSTDIAHYLEKTFPKPALIPDDARLRGQVHVLEDWADESLYFQEMTLRFGIPHNAARWIPELVQRESAFIKAAAPYLVPRVIKRTAGAQGTGRKSAEVIEADLERHALAIEGLLGEGDWLCGEALTLADISVYTQMYCIAGAREGKRVVEAHPKLAGWMTRVDEATGKVPA